MKSKNMELRGNKEVRYRNILPVKAICDICEKWIIICADHKSSLGKRLKKKNWQVLMNGAVLCPKCKVHIQ